jgi:hypothetical protein
MTGAMISVVMTVMMIGVTTTMTSTTTIVIGVGRPTLGAAEPQLIS